MERNKLIDIIRAIGIISIVIGHSAWTITKQDIKIGPFVYMYHLMIFVFISGYLFPVEKIRDRGDIHQYIGRHICKMLILYFIYNTIFVILHNSLIKLNIMEGQFYTKREMIENCLNGIVFRNNERMLGAFWFVPMLLIAEVLFAISIYEIKRARKNKWLYVIFPLMFAIVGITLCIKNIEMLYHIQISIIAVPFMYIGILMQKYWHKVEKYVFTFGWIVSMIILIIFIEMKIGNIELSVNKISNPFMFYPISMIGIYFCLSLAKMFNKIKFVNTFMSYVGKNSFHIMAMHFVAIKVVDVLYSKYKNINNINIISKFPNSYSNTLWLLYIIIGTCLPILLIFVIEKFIKYVKKKKESRNEKFTSNKCNYTNI